MRESLQNEIFKQKGFALAVALIIFGILSILSASYLISIKYDADFTRKMNSSIESVYLARSGIQYYIDLRQPEEISENQGTFYLDDKKQKMFEIKLVLIDDKEHISSTGIIKNSTGVQIGSKTIVAPASDLSGWHEI